MTATPPRNLAADMEAFTVAARNAFQAFSEAFVPAVQAVNDFLVGIARKVGQPDPLSALQAVNAVHRGEVVCDRLAHEDLDGAPCPSCGAAV